MRKLFFRLGMIATLVAAFALAAHPAFAQTNQTLSTGNWLLSIFSAVAMYVAEAIGKFVIAILDITIPLMRYQGFTSSPVVSAGWAVVRDVVNMFFVVVLIIIAMGTIFGSSRFQWKQAVPRLMIFAIVINFSKTLCGIMIDFAQVVMLTFANALKDIAGGNFIQLLGLGDIFSLSDKADAIAQSAAGSGTGTGPFDYFVASVAAVLMMVWVLAVVIMLLFILVYRVVMLWILIVLAPLAWFMGGQTVLKSGSEAYSEWWRNFICYTAIGPVITFFLWLTLAVAGSGFIAANDPGLSSLASGGNLSSNVSNVVTKVFEFQRLLSFVIGMAMMMVGFDAAAKICHGVKGPGFQALLSAGKGVPSKIGGYVGGQARKYGGKGLASGFAGAQSALTGTGAGLLAATAGGAGLAALAPTKSGQAARAQGMRDLSKKNWLPTEVSTKLATSADERQADLAKQLKTAAEGTFKGASGETKLDYLKKIAEGGSIPLGQEATAMGLFAEALKDPKMREKMEASGILGKMYKDMGMGADLKKFVRNTPDEKTIDDFEESRPDITGKIDKIDSTNVSKLDASALADSDVQNELGNIESDVFDKSLGRNLTEYEAIEQGKRGKKKQAALRGGKGALYSTMTDAVLKTVPSENLAKNWHHSLAGKEGVAQRVFGVNDAAWGKMDANGKEDVITAIGTDAAMKANAMRTMMAAKERFGTLKTGVGANMAASLTREEIQQMMVAYKKASPEDQEEMEEMLADVESVLSDRGEIPAGSVDANGRPQHTAESANAGARHAELTSALSDAQKATLKPLQKSYEQSQKEFGELAAELADAEQSYQVLEDQRVNVTTGLKPGAANYMPEVRAAIDRAEAAKKAVEDLRAKVADVQSKADAAAARLKTRKIT